MEPLPGRNVLTNTPEKVKDFYEREELWWYIGILDSGMNPRKIPLHEAASKHNWGWWWRA